MLGPSKSNVLVHLIGGLVCLILLGVCICGLINVHHQHEKRQEELVNMVTNLLLIEKEYAYAEGQYDALTTNKICIEIVSSNEWKYIRTPWDTKGMQPRFTNRADYLQVITGQRLTPLGIKK